jgi:hypothetical protein
MEKIHLPARLAPELPAMLFQVTLPEKRNNVAKRVEALPYKYG